jgi:glycine/D-amino acid oxidase-like deaminating enzyme
LNVNRYIDLLIIGQGIAGSLLAFEANKLGLTYVIIDEGLTQTSSRVAAGMFCPISGKRMVKSWLVNDLLPVMKQTYTELELVLDKQFFFNRNVYQVFGSIKEQNDLFTRAEDASFAQFVDFNPTSVNAIKQPFGAFSISDSGYLNTAVFLSAFKQWLLSKRQIISRIFNGKDLIWQNGFWHYNGIKAKQVVFCDGYKNKVNGFFNFLPYILCKGEVLTVKLPFTTDYIIKKAIYLVHLGESIYKIGATYQWNNVIPEPTQFGLQFLIEKLKELVGNNFEIINHESGIRPTTKDRKPFLGKHPKYANLFVFGGLGTKGIMQAPFLAKHLLNAMLFNTPILPEADINRCLKN